MSTARRVGRTRSHRQPAAAEGHSETASSEELTQRRARSFGDVADLYQRARPTYPRSAVEWLLEPAPGRAVLDLAAGTGKLTGVLLAAGYDVTAVEPSPGMLAQLRAAHPGARTLEGTAEEIPLADASVDAVLVGQAFHWFDTDRAPGEMARVLGPGGVAGLLWNVRDDGVPWVARLSEALGGAPDTLSAARPSLREEPLGLHPAFGGVERRDFPNPHDFTRARLLEWAQSTSSVSVMEPESRHEVLAAVERLCADDPALRGRESFEVPFVTTCVRAMRGGR